MDNARMDRSYGNECYSGSDVLRTSIMIAIILWLLVLIFSSMPNNSFYNRCSDAFFSPPEKDVLGGMGSINSKTVKSVDDSEMFKRIDPIPTPPPKLNTKSNFDNDLPNQETPIPTDGTNYSDIAANMALESGVVKQHNQYVKQREKYTGTASFNPERSDSQDIVPFVGLRKTSYLTPKGESLLDPTARQVPSVVDPSSLSKPTGLNWNSGGFV